MTKGNTDGVQSADRAFEALPYVSLVGLALLVVDLMLSFEEPHTTMLGLAGLLVLVTPIAVLVRLAASSEFSNAERSAWFRGLAGRNGPRLFTAFFSRSARARQTAILTGPNRLDE